VIDCSPEGFQLPVPTRIFEAVQQPVCIVLALRDHSTTSETPAPTRFHRLTKGTRVDKFAQLANLSLTSADWESCPDEWRAPFLPAGAARWMSYPALEDLLRWSGQAPWQGAVHRAGPVQLRGADLGDCAAAARRGGRPGRRGAGPQVSPSAPPPQPAASSDAAMADAALRTPGLGSAGWRFAGSDRSARLSSFLRSCAASG
jgi:hypothetical protein